MDIKKIEKLATLLKTFSLSEVEYQDEGTRIKLVSAVKNTSAIPQTVYTAPVQHPVASELKASAPQAQEAHKYKEIRSPFVGTYYAAPSPGSDDFVHVGKKVKKVDTLCIVEAMKLMNEIEADQDGIIVEILINNESPVEFDQVLFRME